MHGTTEAPNQSDSQQTTSSAMPALLPTLPASVPTDAESKQSFVTLKQENVLAPPISELSWDDLYISQELRTAYFYYKLGVSRLMNNQQSFLVSILKQNNCTVLSHEQIAAIQMKQDPFDFATFHSRPLKWSVKHFTSTELHRAYMFYNEKLSRFSNVGRSAQQMEKALNNADCPVLTRFEIAEIQRKKKRDLLFKSSPSLGSDSSSPSSSVSAATSTSPTSLGQVAVGQRKRRVVRRRTAFFDAGVVLSDRTRKRVPASNTLSGSSSSSEEEKHTRPTKRVRSRVPRETEAPVPVLFEFESSSSYTSASSSVPSRFQAHSSFSHYPTHQSYVSPFSLVPSPQDPFDDGPFKFESDPLFSLPQLGAEVSVLNPPSSPESAGDSESFDSSSESLSPDYYCDELSSPSSSASSSPEFMPLPPAVPASYPNVPLYFASFDAAPFPPPQFAFACAEQSAPLDGFVGWN